MDKVLQIFNLIARTYIIFVCVTCYIRLIQLLIYHEPVEDFYV